MRPNPGDKLWLISSGGVLIGALCGRADRTGERKMKEMENGGNEPADRYEFEVIGQKKPGLVKKIFFQLIRYALVAGFLYIAYLGFTMRMPGPTPPPEPSQGSPEKPVSPPAANPY